MITWIPYTGYGTMEQREKPNRNESFTQREQRRGIAPFFSVVARPTLACRIRVCKIRARLD